MVLDLDSDLVLRPSPSEIFKLDPPGLIVAPALSSRLDPPGLAVAPGLSSRLDPPGLALSSRLDPPGPGTMYYLQLDKEPLYSAQSRFVGPPQYQDFGYHPHPGLSEPPPAPQPGHGAWSAAYPPPATPRDEWAHYGHAHSNPSTAPGPPPPPGPTSVAPGLGFGPSDYPGPPPALLPSTLSSTSGLGSSGPLSPGSPQRRTPYEWIRRSAPPTNPNGKTRTKDKYRVVYTDHQRLELEKEFHYSKYITIRRKAELASALSLSERQVKIWFQNRRAKERKINKKKQQQPASSTTTATPPSVTPGNSSSSSAMVTSSISIKEEF